MDNAEMASIREDSAENLFAFQGRRLDALDKSNGAVLWTHFLANQISGKISIVNAARKNDKVVITYGASGFQSPALGFEVLNGQTGQVLSQSSLDQMANILKISDHYIYLTTVFSNEVRVFSY